MPRVDLDQLDLSSGHLAVLQQLLMRHVPGFEVWAYGSRVNGMAHEGSDLDLVLRCPPHSDSDTSHWFELTEALQESALPMRVDVHLWSRLPATFYPEIEKRYVVLQEGAMQRSDCQTPALH